MATTFKTFLNTDRTSTKTLLHEAIPITGTIGSGTYAEANIKKYSHGMFESVYDYPYLSSSANHIFDITFGYHSSSLLQDVGNPQNNKKINIYNQMAQVLMGHDHTGGIQQFDADGDLTQAGGKFVNTHFVNFSRLLTKDEIKKGTFSIGFNTGGIPFDVNAAWSRTASPGSGDIGPHLKTLYDTNAANEFRTTSPAGEFGILYTSSVVADIVEGSGLGLIFYQAGIIVVPTAAFSASHSSEAFLNVHSTSSQWGTAGATYDTSSMAAVITGANITDIADGLRNRIHNIAFNNTTELNSTIYFCRANHNEFNYSSNPTYLTASQLRVKNTTSDMPVSYITSIGMYSADNELLAVAKVSEPLKKDPNTELTLRVRLDY